MPHGRSLGGVAPEQIFLVWHAPHAHRCLTMAWRFLEDAQEMTRRAEPSVSGVTMDSERYYGGCATHLRNACIAHFGDPREVPDDELMGFVTAMRHASAHTKQDNIRSHIRNFDLTWDPATKTGEFLLAVGMQWRASPDDKEFAPSLASFLAKHDGNPYLALHAAMRTIAGWIDKPLDADFEALVDAPAGDLLIHQPIHSEAAYRQLERMVQGRVDWEVDPGNLRVSFGRMTSPRKWKASRRRLPGGAPPSRQPPSRTAPRKR